MKNIILFGLLLLPCLLLAQENVGVNINSPEFTLDVRSSSIAAPSQFNISNLDKSKYVRFFSGSDAYPDPSMTWKPGYNFLFATFDDLSLDFSEKMRINSLGKVGIGVSDPQARLDIKGGNWNLEGGSAGDLRIGNATYNIRIGVATGGGGAGIGRIFTGEGVNNLIFGTNDTKRMVVHESGNVGIGLDDPLTKLHVNGDFRVNNLSGTGDRNVIVDGNGKFKIGTIGEGDTDWLETSTHVISPKTARLITTTISGIITTNDWIDFNSTGFDKWKSFNSGAPFGTTMKIQSDSGGNLELVEGGGSVGIGGAANSKLTVTGNENDGNIASLEIKTSPLGDQLLMDNNEIDVTGQGNIMYLNANSQNPISIGSHNSAQGYMLNVDGKVIAEEIKVQLSGSWPDYVFRDSYALKSLKEVEDHIKAHGHLPGIPKADILENEGLSLGEMQRKMMEKIEELTLYVIDLAKKNAQLQSELSLLKKESE